MPAISFNGPDGNPPRSPPSRARAVGQYMGDLVRALPVGNAGARPAATAAGSDSFEVVAINVDTSRPERPKAFLNEIDVRNSKLLRGRYFFPAPAGGELVGLPATFLVDAAGCANRSAFRPAVWDSAEALALVQRRERGAGSSKDGLRPWTADSSRVLVGVALDQVARRALRDAARRGARSFLLLDYPEWVHVAAFDEEDRLLLVRQYRHGAGKMSLELPGGVMDPMKTIRWSPAPASFWRRRAMSRRR